MTFTVKDWKDYPPSEETPIDATALEDLERRLSDYADAQISALTNRVAELEEQIEAANAGAIAQGQMHSYLDANGDFWLVMNATLDGSAWNRIDTTKYSYAMQWIVNGVIPGEESIDPIGGVVFWRAIPGANPILPTFGAYGGWENVFLFTQYRDPVIGGQAIEVDGAGTFPFGRVIHAPEGTWLGQNAYADLNGRDDPAQDSLVLGVFGDAIKARLWRGNEPKENTVDLFTLDKSGNLHVAGSVTEGTP